MNETSARLARPSGLATTEGRRDALRRSGVTQGELAARAGVSRQSIGLVLAGHHRSRHVEQAIADACGLRPEEMFGGGSATAAAAPAMPVASARGTAVDGPTGPRSTARVESTQPIAGPRETATELERRVAAQLRALAEEIFLAIAGQGLAADRPVVRAAAAALRELGPVTTPSDQR